MQTLNQIVKNLNNIADSHYQIHSFAYDQVENIASSGTTIYPLMFAQVLTSNINGKVLNLNMNISIMDLVHKGDTNIQDVDSDTLLIIGDVINQLLHPDYAFRLDNDSVRIEPFREKFADEVTGWSADVTFIIPFDTDRCAIPTESITIIS